MKSRRTYQIRLYAARKAAKNVASRAKSTYVVMVVVLGKGGVLRRDTFVVGQEQDEPFLRVFLAGLDELVQADLGEYGAQAFETVQIYIAGGKEKFHELVRETVYDAMTTPS